MTDDAEVLSTPLDKRAAGRGFPGEGFRRRTGNNPSRAVLWAATEAVDFPPADEPMAVWGAYPKRFAEWAITVLQCRASEVLHVCIWCDARPRLPHPRADHLRA